MESWPQVMDKQPGGTAMLEMAPQTPFFYPLQTPILPFSSHRWPLDINGTWLFSVLLHRSSVSQLFPALVLSASNKLAESWGDCGSYISVPTEGWV